jgi:hypothetical protein
MSGGQPFFSWHICKWATRRGEASMKKETLTIILGLCLLFATVTATVPTSARGQNDAPPPPHARSPAMVQAGQAFQRGDYAGAAAVMRTAAQHGDLEAQVVLGKFYIEGRGVPQNYFEGMRLIEAVVLRHQEPSYSVAVSALRSIAPKSPPNGNRPVDMASAAADLNAAVGDLKKQLRERWQHLSPAEKSLLIQLNRPSSSSIMMCNAFMCF